MRRTTVKIDDELDQVLRHEARMRGMTISEVTREALGEYLARRTRSRGGRRLIAAAAGRSGRRDVSERIEEILRAELR